MFLFLILLIIDIVKDTLTRKVDEVFGYVTISNFFSKKTANSIVISLQIITLIISAGIIDKTGLNGIMEYYFAAGLFVFILCIFLMINPTRKSKFMTLNILRLWVFIGIISMLLNGICGKI